MHEVLFHRQQALDDDDLLRYAGELGLETVAHQIAGNLTALGANRVDLNTAEDSPTRRS